VTRVTVVPGSSIRSYRRARFEHGSLREGEPVKRVLVCLVLCALVGTRASADLTAQQEQSALHEHNDIRSDVASGLVGNEPTATDMVKLAWDDDLAEVAQGWVDQCDWGHNPNRTAQYGALAGGSTYVGENLYVYLTTSSSTPNIVPLALDAWFDEQQNYNYGPVQGSSPAGHYTQLVWADTHRVGCALAVCPGSAFGYSNAYTGYYLACDYARGGNYIGQYPYEAGPTASECPPEYPAVEDGLCVMPEPGGIAMLGSGMLLLAQLRRRRPRIT
jgi:hypothetical protein